MAKSILRIYTDGGCRNTGTGKGDHVKHSDRSAWAYLIIGPHTRFHNTYAYRGYTNNQMELTGVIHALQFVLARVAKYQHKEVRSIKFSAPVTVYSDSRYVDNAFNQHWLNRWVKQGLDGIKNEPYWKRLAQLTAHFTNLQFVWVKGHATNRGNIYVDHLLNHAMDQL